MGNEIILFPLAAMGHLNPMVEFGNLLHRHTGLSITILISQSSSIDNKPIDSYISLVSAVHPNLSFHHLPPPSTSSDSTFLDDFHLTIPHLKSYLSASSARAIILDFFFDAALETVTDLHLPCYFFFASSASNLSAFLHLPTLHRKLTASFRDMGDTPIHFPGSPTPIPASDMPIRISDRTSKHYKAVIVQYERLARAAGIIVNSFRALEPKAVQALSESGVPIYCVGPVTADAGREGGHESLFLWLDGQPRGSVVFLCFGSMGSAFSKEQVREIAEGLERSGQRFLWVVRGAVVPEGFEERIKGRGLVVRSWAPQVEVLRHVAVGGFVTHCGWNSALEAIVAGVAMIGWPLYAEQRMNKVFLVEEAKLAVEMKGYKSGGIVESGEVEERVRWLMEDKGGEELRARAAAAGERGRAALQENGSSYQAMVEIARLVNSIIPGFGQNVNR